MSQQDLELCRGLLKVLKSEKNSKFNALFLFPFDIAHTPGYLDICGPRVMDLSTLSQNLENGRYCKRKEVYDDCNLIFENAMKVKNSNLSSFTSMMFVFQIFVLR
jgi:hypothetical protein